MRPNGAACGSTIVRGGARCQPIWLPGVRTHVAKLIAAPTVVSHFHGAGRVNPGPPPANMAPTASEDCRRPRHAYLWYTFRAAAAVWYSRLAVAVSGPADGLAELAAFRVGAP